MTGAFAEECKLQCWKMKLLQLYNVPSTGLSERARECLTLEKLSLEKT